VVEDEPAILNVTTMILTRQGYTVLQANSPKEAINLAHEHANEIDLLITDLIMPEMNGKGLAEELQSRYPRLKCLFMSGYTANAIVHRGILVEGVNYIHKPFSVPDLAAKVREVLDHKSGPQHTL
jgi:two-component system, cell cycle sensor histidine kinase and response regulator CckA